MKLFGYCILINIMSCVTAVFPGGQKHCYYKVLVINAHIYHVKFQDGTMCKLKRIRLFVNKIFYCSNFSIYVCAIFDAMRTKSAHLQLNNEKNHGITFMFPNVFSLLFVLFISFRFMPIHR